MALGLAAALLAATVLHRRVPHEDGGRAAVAAIEPAPPPPAASPAKASPPPPESGDTVEVQNGVKIIRLAPPASPASVSIPVQASHVRGLAPAPDPRLVEDTPEGPLPRIGKDGARASAVYAHPFAPAAAGGGPRLALVAADMGRDQVRTAALARRLPPEVTFAFPPDAPDIGAQVADVRAAGHEVILQLPAAVAAPAQAAAAPLAPLHGAMARFAGYVGTGSTAPLAPLLRDDIERRGLLTLDATPADGGGAGHVSVVVPAADAKPALESLLATARAHGAAIGWLDGPGDPDTLATYAASLPGQAITLVPLSALAEPPAAHAQAGP